MVASASGRPLRVRDLNNPIALRVHPAETFHRTVNGRLVADRVTPLAELEMSRVSGSRVEGNFSRPSWLYWPGRTARWGKLPDGTAVGVPCLAGRGLPCGGVLVRPASVVGGGRCPGRKQKSPRKPSVTSYGIACVRWGARSPRSLRRWVAGSTCGDESCRRGERPRISRRRRVLAAGGYSCRSEYGVEGAGQQLVMTRVIGGLLIG